MFDESALITEDGTLMYNDEESHRLLDSSYKKTKGEDYLTTEFFAGYDEDNIYAIYHRRLVGPYTKKEDAKNITQIFERKDKENPCRIFETGKTIGFIDGNEIRVFDLEGKCHTFSVEEPIEKFEINDGYVVLNDHIVISMLIKSRDKVIPSIMDVKNVEHLRNLKITRNLETDDFVQNENGAFCIVGLSDEEKLEIYKQNGFTEKYESLKKRIEQRKESNNIGAKKAKEEREKLHQYVDTMEELLLPVVFSNPANRSTLENAKIYSEDGNGNYTEHGRYYADDPHTQALYGVQVKGWRGSAYEGFIISLETAKKMIRNGKLHLNVPEEHMGMIIGFKGSNIKYVEESLRKKGIDISKIILHPKNKDEMNVTFKEIERKIEKNRNGVSIDD